MTKLILEVAQNQDLHLLLALLKKLNVKVVHKVTTTDLPEVPNDNQRHFDDAFTLNDFQEAMGISDEEMTLTFGEEYLSKNKWHPTQA